MYQTLPATFGRATSSDAATASDATASGGAATTFGRLASGGATALAARESRSIFCSRVWMRDPSTQFNGVSTP